MTSYVMEEDDGRTSAGTWGVRLRRPRCYMNALLSLVAGCAVVLRTLIYIASCRYRWSCACAALQMYIPYRNRDNGEKLWYCRLQELARTGWKRGSLPLEPEPTGKHDEGQDNKCHSQCDLIRFSIEDAPASHVPPSLCAK